MNNELTLGPIEHVTVIHESMKEDFVCLSHSDLPNHGTYHHAIGIIGKSSMGRVHQGDFVMFRATMQELLNFEHFFKKNFNKIKS